jgi:hypothetical protein
VKNLSSRPGPVNPRNFKVLPLSNNSLIQFVSLIKSTVPIIEGFGQAATGDWSAGLEKMKSGFSNFGDANVTEWLKYQKEKENVWRDILGIEPTTLDIPAAPGRHGASGAGVSGTTTGAAGKTATAGVQTVQAGTRNVTLNIQKLIGEIKFESYTGQSESRMMEMVKKALLAAVNDVNIQINKTHR